MIFCPNMPQILKANRIEGKTLVFRNVVTEDAAFILSLRTENRKAMHLSYTSPELNKQISWLEDYAKRNDQAYFIIENKSSDRLGLVRLYDPQDKSFCWGSWILKAGVPPNASIESALIVYSYAIGHLGFIESHFDVRKGNERVWLFHERFGAIRVAETDQDYLYRIELDAIAIAQQRYRKYLPNPIIVEEYDGY
jgi:hypothetical protein